MQEIDARFAAALHNAARAWRQALDRRLKHLGVSGAGWMTIAVAAKAQGAPPSQSEIADSLGVEGATMVAMVDRLVAAGLVLREQSAADRRVKRIVLTDAGKRLYTKVRAEAESFRAELLSNFDPDQLAAAASLLERLERIAEGRLTS